MIIFQTTYNAVLIRLGDTGCLEVETMLELVNCPIDLVGLFDKYGFDPYIIQGSLQTKLGNFEKEVEYALTHGTMAEEDIQENFNYVKDLICILKKIYITV